MSEQIAPSVHTEAPAHDGGPHPLLTRVAAEAAGTFILVFIGLGALLYSGSLRDVDPLINALAFGVAFAAAAALFVQISGGHINPAISLGAAIGGQLRWADLPAYWLGQLTGAVAAAAVLFLTLPAGLAAQLGVSDQALFSQAANSYGDRSFLAQVTGGALDFDIPTVLVLEAVAAAILTAVVLTRRGRALMPVVAGLVLTGLLLMLEPVSGGSVNPARSTAAAIFAEPAALGQLWLFWLAPLIGGAVAGLAGLLFSSVPAAPQDPWAQADAEGPVWVEDEEAPGESVDDDEPDSSARGDEPDSSARGEEASRSAADGEPDGSADGEPAPAADGGDEPGTSTDDGETAAGPGAGPRT